MNKIIGLYIFVLSHFAFSQDLAQLKNLDIILIPINCQSCFYIAKENDSEFSHSGVVIKESGKIQILQALNGVEKVSLEKFLSLKDAKRKALVLRLKSHPQNNTSDILSIFDKQFNHLRFDHDYLWDNLDQSGREELYCSEFVAKFLNQFLKNNSIQPVKMHFDKYPEFWSKYFKGNIPYGLPGISPGDLERDSHFEKVMSF